VAGDRRLRCSTVLPGLQIAFTVEPLGMLFALIASGLWIVNSLYSIGYMRGNNEANQTRFYVCFALALAATMGIAFAGNLFTLFVFYELLTLITYPLVTHHGTDKARNGGRVYLGILMGTSIVFLLPALVFIWHVAGTTDFTPAASWPASSGTSRWPACSPVHVRHRQGGADAVPPLAAGGHGGATPVSALLHAVAVVKAGVFSVVKVIVYVFGVDNWLRPALAATALVPTGWSGVAGFTIVAASVVALNADNLKRRLAYSTVSQLSYVVMAAALLAPLSLIGAVLHIAAHAVGKITLFFAAGAIYTAAHKTEVSQLDGIGRRMPWTMGAFTIGALSMIGLPPAVGFVSKWYMLSGAMAAQHWLAVAVIVASTLLNAGYFLPIVYRAFFVAPPRAATARPARRGAAADGAGAVRHGRGHGAAVLPA
jgi:multicomponent Na+:H+ antiporter subunit D